MAEIKLRFNTKFEEATSPDLKWRVLVDGVEKLAKTVKILVPCETTQDVIEGGITKWHLSCRGTPVWDGPTLTVKP